MGVRVLSARGGNTVLHHCVPTPGSGLSFDVCDMNRDLKEMCLGEEGTVL